jgi:uncharacterized protein (TIGR00369 family)
VTHDVPNGFELADLGPGFGKAFGPVWLDLAGNRLAFRVAENHINPVGGCHGGAMATFADTQLMALRRGAESGASHSPTISLSVDYFAPAALDAWVEAAVSLVKQTRTMLFTQAIMTVDGDAIARSSAIYRLRTNKGT